MNRQMKIWMIAQKVLKDLEAEDDTDESEAGKEN